LDAVDVAVSQCRKAIGAMAELAGSSEQQNAELAKLLGNAIEFIDRFGGNCPVCETTLPETWANEARTRLRESKTQAAAVREATAGIRRCVQDLRKLITSAPAALDHAEMLELEVDAATVWSRWAAAPEEAAALCDHVEEHAVELAAVVDSLRTEARSRLDAMESTWRPIAIALAGWLRDAHVVVAEDEARLALKKAEKWLKGAESALRDDRFTPIATRAQEIWTLLRQQSNVDLARVKLEGTSTRRRVTLDVSVDGQEGVAVSVMSQGELNALALSLFLPRMTLAESPFRFVVVDDPVQAMDPHKVDGLARVLEEVAQTRQVIVLTHDTRLFEAIRRLGIQARVIEIGRRAKSVVELNEALDPVERHLRDAWFCLKNQHKLSSRVARRTIPGFCRLAVEAACVEAVRRRRLTGGADHADVEQAIEDARGLQSLTALAIADDAEQGDRVYQFLNNKLGRRGGDAFKAIKQSAHGAYDGSLEDLVDSARTLTRTLREVS